MLPFDPMSSSTDDPAPRRVWMGAWVVVAVVAASVKAVVLYAPALTDAFVEAQTARFAEPAIAAPVEPPVEPVFAGDEPVGDDMIRVEFEGEAPAETVTGQRVIMQRIERASEWLCLIA